MNLSYSINGTPATGDKEQIKTNAIKLLTLGTLEGYGNNDVSNSLLNESSSMLTSQLASKTLTDLLLKTGIVESANLKFNTDSLTSTSVSISGSLWNVATWTIGGRIGDIASNYNISINIPITINKKNLNNIVLQILKATDVYNSTFDRNAKDWEIKLKLGGHW
ncbi:hypothetical protein SDC9_178090 [bioreactor metagenome]|uniref:Uncharacterized protein n=1 Tax=bioreactor metagenome TaxID=1076179 RepID=A0A645GXZ6_9ZZZZ